MQTSTFDRLSFDQQRVVRAAAARYTARMDDIQQQQDELLVGTLFARQGLQVLPVSNQLRMDYIHLARAARDRLGEQRVSPALLGRVMSMLADYRAEHYGR